MNSTDVLFQQFPRWAGLKQRMVRSQQELNQYIHTTSGNDECFTSVYAFPFSTNSPIINKLFIESDHKNSLKVGQTIFEWCTENGFPTIPHWSGHRGPHIYPLCPNTYFKNPIEASDFLKKFTYYILEETGQYKEENGLKIPFIDTAIIGDNRRLTRIPETRRTSYAKTPLPTFCISLNPETFTDLSMKDIHKLEKHPNPQPYDYKAVKPKKPFSDCDLSSADLTEWGTSSTSSLPNSATPSPSHIITPIELTIKKLLPRPCIHKYFTNPNAPTSIRYAGVAELVKKGLSPNHIINLITQLKWDNFDPSETSKQVHAIHRKKTSIDSTGKAKLQSMGFCQPEDIAICNKCR